MALQLDGFASLVDRISEFKIEVGIYANIYSSGNTKPSLSDINERTFIIIILNP